MRKDSREFLAPFAEMKISGAFEVLTEKGEKIMPATTGERQIGDKLEDIAPNHRARYAWAADILVNTVRLGAGSHILDAASGVGYGSKMLADTGYSVTAVDRAEESRKYQKFVFASPSVRFIQDDILNIKGTYDAAVSLETIEHVPDKWLDVLGRVTKVLVGTVPNQDIVPFDPKSHPFHLRHYTKVELIEIFAEKGWELSEWATQYGKWGEDEARMRPGDDGMTLGFLALKK